MSSQSEASQKSTDLEGKVLSIQSHVVSGYCGNKSAVFPLQILGFEVDFINSVQFSTHTGYPKWTGQVLNEKDLLDLFEGLQCNNLHTQYTHLLTGYCRSASFLNAMHSVIERVKSASKDVLYLCDPVLGDDNRLYVPEELIALYRDKIIPMADIICPNQFEAEILSGVQITDMESALKALDVFHSKGIETVVISSTSDTFTDIGPNNLMVIASSLRVKTGKSDGVKKQLYKLTIPKLDARFTGTGDLFAALFLAWFKKTGFDLKLTLEKVTATMQAVIHRTFRYASQKGLEPAANRELQMIQSRNDIVDPKIELKAQWI